MRTIKKILPNFYQFESRKTPNDIDNIYIPPRPAQIGKEHFFVCHFQKNFGFQFFYHPAWMFNTHTHTIRPKSARELTVRKKRKKALWTFDELQTNDYQFLFVEDWTWTIYGSRPLPQTTKRLLPFLA